MMFSKMVFNCFHRDMWYESIFLPRPGAQWDHIQAGLLSRPNPRPVMPRIASPSDDIGRSVRRGPAVCARGCGAYRWQALSLVKALWPLGAPGLSGGYHHLPMGAEGQADTEAAHAQAIAG